MSDLRQYQGYVDRRHVFEGVIEPAMEAKTKVLKGEIVDIPAIGLNRFYNVMKDPQENCIEPFLRGGHNSVLETLDNFPYCYETK